ncbi:MAG: hypothetical protein WAN43_08895 [Rhodomicrobium sp.]
MRAEPTNTIIFSMKSPIAVLTNGLPIYGERINNLRGKENERRLAFHHRREFAARAVLHFSRSGLRRRCMLRQCKRRRPLLAKFESVMQNLIDALDSGDKIIEIA